MTGLSACRHRPGDLWVGPPVRPTAIVAPYRLYRATEVVSGVRGENLVARRAAAVGMALLATLFAGCQTAGDDPVDDPVGTTKKPVKLTFMAYGPDEEVAAYEKTVNRFNRENETVRVSLVAA